MKQQYYIVCNCSFKDGTDSSYVEYEITKTINADSDKAASEIAKNWFSENQYSNNLSMENGHLHLTKAHMLNAVYVLKNRKEQKQWQKN
jgi:hypothetical protein